MLMKANDKIVKKGQRIRKQRHATPNGVCFEPLEPRLLLSGSWGAGVDAPSHDSQTSTHGGFTQETVVISEITIGSEADTQHQNPRQTAVHVDLLAQAPVLNAVNAVDPVPEAPSTPDQAAPAAGNTPTNSTESDSDMQPDRVAAAGVRELVFVNENIAGYQQLIADLQGDDNRIIEVAVLDADRDGIEQVSKILADRSDLAAVHFVTHGTDGQIDLGNTWLNSVTLQQNIDSISAWGDALTSDGDILFYGCNIAADITGQGLLNSIADLTGADVAASDDVTGNAGMGGDWVLEYTKGAVETATAFTATVQKGWTGVLGQITVTTTNDTLDGDADTSSLAALAANPGTDGEVSLREAIIAANTDAGVADEIVLNAGTYGLTLGPSGDDSAARGDLDITDELTITGAGARTTSIDGMAADRVFELLGSTVTISGITIQNGSAADGGGIRLDASSSLTLRDAAVSGNHASNVGGGIFVSGVLTIERVAIEGNSADVGGGLYINNGVTGTIVNSTISGNTAASDGGGIFTRSTVDITNSTIAENTGGSGAGGIHKSGSGNVRIKNTILDNNSGGNTNGALITLGNNIDSLNTAGLDMMLGDQIMTDPLLGMLQYNSGPTKTHALLAGSPAIDNADRASMPNTDQRGFLRGDGSPDIGAYEFGANAATTAHYLDQFNTESSFAGDDGSLSWSGDWQEINETNGASMGNVSVYIHPVYGSEPVLSLWKDHVGVWREADLSGATSATLSFNWALYSVDPGDFVTLEISTDGGVSWDLIDSFNGPADHSSLQAASYDISAYAGNNVRIKFETSTFGDNDEFLLDNVRIDLGVTGVLTVDTATDVDDGDTSSISALIATPGADGSISLREAIAAANATSGLDRIHFDISGAGPHIITLDPAEGALPFITDAVIIDGTSEPDYSGAPVVQINGSALSAVAGDNYDGFRLEPGSDGSTIRGLSITGFTDDGNFGAAFNIRSDDNHIAGNYIGLTPDGVTAASNRTGVILQNGADDNVIGGINTADRNLISGSLYAGVNILNSITDHNRVIGNYIGLDKNGDVVTSGTFGVLVWDSSSDNEIGGINGGEGNRIAGHREGVVIDNAAMPGLNNAILGNAIYANRELAIDLNNDWITLNDTNDSDNGPNDLLNYPVITSVTQNGTDLDIQFDLDVPAGNYRIEFFDNPNGINASGYGGGEIFLGAVTVTSLGTGTQTFNETLTGVSMTDATTVTATATEDLGGNNFGSTSEFGPALSVTTIVGAIKDTYLDDNNPANNYGTSTSLVMDESGGGLGEGHVLLQFDLSAIPAGAVITNATLQLQAVSKTDIGSTDIHIYEVTETWDEGTGGTTAANWNNRQPDIPTDTPWSTPGGTIDPTVAATLTTSSIGQHTWNITALVQAWNDGVKTNNGLMLASDDFGLVAFTYDSREGSTPPKLVISYSSPDANTAPTTSPVTLVAIGEDSGARTITQAELLSNASDIEGDSLTATVLIISTGGGTLVDNGDGTWDYTPAGDDDTSVSFSYTITDGTDSVAGSASLDITPINDPPTTSPVTLASISEDSGARTITQAELLANAADVDGPGLTTTGLAISAGSGTLADNGDGTWDYTPAGDDDTAVSFSYTITDGTDSVAGSASLDITPINDPPTTSPVTLASISEDSGARTITQAELLANAADVDGPGLTTTGLAISAGSGTLADNGDGTWDYTPAGDDDTAVSFSYTITDGTDSVAGSASLDITPVNDAPVGVDDTASTNEDTPVTVNVVSNDTDVEGDPLTVSAVTQGTNGAVTFGGGSVTYTPNANFSGTDSFTYTVSDGNGGTDTATIDVTVNPVNDAPVAVDDSASTNEDTPVTVNVVSNDTDIEGDPLTVSAVTQGTNGTVTFAGGTVTYTPNADFSGPDTFTYTVSDGNGGTDTATVDVMVNPVNDAPVAVDDSASTNEDTPVTVNVVSNDTDIEGDPLTVSAVTQGTNGAVTFAGGTVTYTPNANFSGPDSFTYTVSDGNGGTDTATVYVTVNPVNDAPVAVDDSASTNEDTPVTVNVVSNETDVEGDPLTVSAVTQGTNGTVTFAGGTVTYTPNANFSGPDTFTYTVSDGNGGTDTATVDVTVSPVNDAPVAVDDNASTNEDTPVTVNVVSNDTDIEGDPLTVSAVTQGTNGTVTFAGGTVTYTPNANFSGTDSFTYTVSDGNGGTDTATVDVTVNPVNDAPVAVDDSASTNEDTPVTVNVVSNDTDVEGDSLTVSAVTQGTNGTVTFAGGTVTYTPNSNFSGPDTFTYTVSDGNGGTDTATVDVTVSPVNDPGTVTIEQPDAGARRYPDGQCD